ncbi:triphosphoribosyl-dephospho-CoA synthase [Streptomyces sp. MnatMP-M27]|uniref:triphosphoribosyl-dephospho-CoA synthase n=1 Tax=Streptomyces TaxID=1883 RepID=UPI00081F319F|nr:triphosphoribosyl-dephospho-CoA synthase [Streptomyces sp. MnatMP-M27]SCF62563.1 triphosphoribosyl-dephospho-CoA synthase [Streptomyces sp. MnatMP-M27]
MFEAGGTATPEGAAALAALDTELRERDIAPRGSAALLAGALFLDGLPAPAGMASSGR